MGHKTPSRYRVTTISRSQTLVNKNEKKGQSADLLHLRSQSSTMLQLCRGNWVWVDVIILAGLFVSNGVFVSFGVKTIDLFSGMSALQCAAVALKTNMSEVKGSMSPNHSRLQTLRQEYMRETLECLLQIGTYQHTTVCSSATGKNLLPDLSILMGLGSSSKTVLEVAVLFTMT